jgi:hypothetical protein
MPGNTGFKGDDFQGAPDHGVYLGTVVDRDDPDGLCRIRARVPGRNERTPWARPRGGGSRYRGKADVPPLGADVYVDYINGDRRMPRYEPADYGIVDGESEVFPEHVDPDVHVFGIGPFRIVIDNREPAEGEARTMRAKLVKEVGGEEQDIAWIEISEDNSIQIYADSAVGIEAGGIVDIDASVVQVKGRKVMGTPRPIN